MNQRAEYVHKLQAEIEQWDARIERFQALLESPEQEEQINVKKQVDELREYRQAAVEELDKLKHVEDDSWEDLKHRADRVWDDMDRAMQDAVKRFK